MLLKSRQHMKAVKVDRFLPSDSCCCFCQLALTQSADTGDSWQSLIGGPFGFWGQLSARKCFRRSDTCTSAWRQNSWAKTRCTWGCRLWQNGSETKATGSPRTSLPSMVHPFLPPRHFAILPFCHFAILPFLPFCHFAILPPRTLPSRLLLQIAAQLVVTKETVVQKCNPRAASPSVFSPPQAQSSSCSCSRT